MVNDKREQIGIWFQAARPRTLTLAIAGVGMGIFLAASNGAFDLAIAVLTLLTASLLQILSNLANDYGDTVHGADHGQRSGPSRAVQSGRVSAQKMRRAILVVAGLCAFSGILLLWLALGVDGLLILAAFLLLGALAIWAAISYTAGRLPYGYVGLGDFAVLVFFGWVGVLGSTYLQALDLSAALLLPATSCGLFAVAVLNVNNIRDIDSDRMAGKRSIPVRVGLRRARLYHWLLLLCGFLAAAIYVVIDYRSPWQLLFVASAPLFVQNGRAVSRVAPNELNRYLGQLSLATLLFVICFGIGQLLA
jgi:1,4-dihydroxy-2-naphthoate octaprenyltransferase